MNKEHNREEWKCVLADLLLDHNITISHSDTELALFELFEEQIDQARKETLDEVIGVVEEHRQAIGLNPFYHAEIVAQRKAYNTALDDLLTKLKALKNK